MNNELLNVPNRDPPKRRPERPEQQRNEPRHWHTTSNEAKTSPKKSAPAASSDKAVLSAPLFGIGLWRFAELCLAYVRRDRGYIFHYYGMTVHNKKSNNT